MAPHKIILFFALPLLMGCVNIPSNHRSTSEMWGGYEPDSVYTIQKDVFVKQLGRTDGLAGKRLALVPPGNLKIGGRQESVPASIDAFKQDPVASTKHIVGSVELKDEIAGIATKGTRVRTARVRRDHGWSMWFGKHDWITPFGVFLDGSFAGREADLTDMSESYSRTNCKWRTYQPIESLLTRAK